MIAAVQHDDRAGEDYALLRTMGIRTARDAVRWHLIDRAGQYDFRSLAPMAEAAEHNGIQVIWNLCHYGWPNDIDIFTPAFVDRFARFSGAIARFFADRSDAVPFYTPVNEISFFAWAASRTLMYPFAHRRDAELKCQLVRAAIAACEAIWDVDRRARIVYPEPTIRCVPPLGRPEFAKEAERQHLSQFEAWDMIAGRAYPELGGHPRYLDILGSNYYCSNQWEHPGGVRLRWDSTPRDERWWPLNRLLADIYNRYERPLFVAETGHYGIGRAQWLRDITAEVYQALLEGIPVKGVCLYPILDRHDWENPNHWHNSGLWDLWPDEKGRFERVLNRDYAEQLASSRKLSAAIGCD